MSSHGQHDGHGAVVVPKKDTIGMDYVSVYADVMSGPTDTVTISTERIQRAVVRWEHLVERRDIVRTIRSAGAVTCLRIRPQTPERTRPQES